MENRSNFRRERINLAKQRPVFGNSPRSLTKPWHDIPGLVFSVFKGIEDPDPLLNRGGIPDIASTDCTCPAAILSSQVCHFAGYIRGYPFMIYPFAAGRVLAVSPFLHHSVFAFPTLPCERCTIPVRSGQAGQVHTPCAYSSHPDEASSSSRYHRGVPEQWSS